MKNIKFKYLFSLIITLGLFVTSCTNETTEPTTSVNKIEYEPTQKETNAQADDLLNETMQAVSEMIIKQSFVKTPANQLAKSQDKHDYYYFAGKHIWRGEINDTIFGYSNAYTAEYLAKLGFIDSSGAPQYWPGGALKMEGSLKAHSALGFVDGQPYGDEYWYRFNGVVTPTTAFPSVVNFQGEYERRWVGVYNGEDTELHYLVRTYAQNLKYYYRFTDNDYWLDGSVNVLIGPYKLVFRFNNSRKAYIKVYKNGAVVQTRMLILPNFYEMFNVPSLNAVEDMDFGSMFTFPTPISLPL